ncbi:unnamed protein product, partial [Mesorhabditis belari]|uniref:Fatty acid hydroxylase domain-containing protein n=1 Tax=Mesorhabditis belari TaxID=2138241 RepID=A0AAF3ESD9_9BILA
MLHHWYPQPSFNETELILEKQHRLLQPIWDFVKHGNEPILSSPLFPPFYALSIDYTFVAIFTVIDLFLYDVPFFKKYKIQKDRKVTWDLMKKSFVLQFWNQLLWIYPMALVQLIWVPPTFLPELAPTLFEFLTQLTIFFLAFDFTYFWFHYTFHKVTAQHLHPFELFFVGTFITAIPWIFPTHCFTYYTWLFIAQAVSYEVHLGYDFPFALHRFLFFYSGAPAHDMHHLRPLTCFEPWLNYLDKLMGYHITYEDLKKMAQEKSKKFGRYAREDEQGLEKIN